MFPKSFILNAALLAAVTSAVPLFQRDSCREGTYNCVGGKQFAACLPDGTWSAMMPVAAGTSCQPGVSANPFSGTPSSSSSISHSGSESSSSHSSISSSGSSINSDPSPTSSELADKPTSELARPTQSASEPVNTTTSDSSSSEPVNTTTSDLSSSDSTPTESDSMPAPKQTGHTALEVGASSTPPSGSGSDCGQFVCMADWPSWETMKAKYLPIMGTACEANGWGANNSPEESQQIISAIESHASSLDPRYALAIVIQESAGCVRVVTTNNGIRNPGLMQDFNGAHTCNENGILNPCPVDQINGMIADGIGGGDDNLIKAVGAAVAAGYKDAMAYAISSRVYNSGSYDAANLSNPLGATASYVTDVMSRLAGQKI